MIWCECYVCLEFVFWLDEGLREVVQELIWFFFILWIDLCYYYSKMLIVDVSYEGFQFVGDVFVLENQWLFQYSCVLCFIWKGCIFVLESYEEFYVGLIFVVEKGYQVVCVVFGFFVEIVSDFNFWIEQILEQNGNIDVFLFYGELVLDWVMGKGMGWFFLFGVGLEESGYYLVFFWIGEVGLMLEQQVEFEEEVVWCKEDMCQQMFVKFWYCYLFIIFELYFLEVFCEDLLCWEWIMVLVIED